MKIFIRTVILFVSFLLAMSCRNEADHVFLTVEDVADEKLAFQKGDLSKSQIASLFPEAETRYFSSTSEMLMSLSIHKFDACVVSSALADKILAELKDYALLEQPDSDCDSIKVVVHKSRIPGRKILEDDTFGSGRDACNLHHCLAACHAHCNIHDIAGLCEAFEIHMAHIDFLYSHPSRCAVDRSDLLLLLHCLCEI